METLNSHSLMLGDWVCTEHDSTPRQIDWIRGGEIGLFWNKVVTPPYLKPIPLTREILERNGFKFYEQDFTSSPIYKFGNFDYIECDEYHKYFDIGCKVTYKHFTTECTYIHSLMRIYHVHELQHALRLCGIDKEIEL